MQRSKQQALMFLLGAVLVGGVLGFSADRLFDHDERGPWAGRMRMSDVIEPPPLVQGDEEPGRRAPAERLGIAAGIADDPRGRPTGGMGR